jgi:hypothetical protein
VYGCDSFYRIRTQLVQVYACGFNGSGQLALGHFANASAPVRVRDLDSRTGVNAIECACMCECARVAVVAIAAGGHSSAVIVRDDIDNLQPPVHTSVNSALGAATASGTANAIVNGLSVLTVTWNVNGAQVCVGGVVCHRRRLHTFLLCRLN